MLFDNLIKQLSIQSLGNQVAAAFDRMGVSLNSFVGEVLKSLPGIGQMIRAFETLGFLRDQLATGSSGTTPLAALL